MNYSHIFLLSIYNLSVRDVFIYQIFLISELGYVMIYFSYFIGYFIT